MLNARDVKDFISGRTGRQTAVMLALRWSAEMFGELCKLQKSGFFSIGHSLAALAFVVCGALKLIRGMDRNSTGPSGQSLCTA
ncbi:hypothetical protein TRP66_20160 [Pseudomonas sp. JDS28PS106]|uniref:hypothetical protein n=1 Tax=Pseudomonas sp. JDS28PS106 TaxID=2497235 RepID=UPI002FCFCCBF